MASTGLLSQDSASYAKGMHEGQLIVADKGGSVTYVCGLCLTIDPKAQAGHIGFWHSKKDPDIPDLLVCLDCGENELAPPCNSNTNKHRLYYAVTKAVPLCGKCQLRAAKSRTSFLNIQPLMAKAKGWFLEMGYWNHPKTKTKCQLKPIGQHLLKKAGYDSY